MANACIRQVEPAFYQLHTKSLIKEQQNNYYKVLSEADKAASSTGFIDFMLEIIRASLLAWLAETDQVTDQVKRLLSVMDDQYWSVSELMDALSLSHRPTFRKNYLIPALETNLIKIRFPDSPRSPKQQYRQKP